MDSEKIYLTNEVADLLDISVPTVRNYAKALERADHEFKMRKQARLWTNVELNMVREVQHLYNAKDYPLELCFQYVVKRHYEGDNVAAELLAQPQYITQEQANNPQLQALSHDIKAIMEGIGDIKNRFEPQNELLEYRSQTERELIDLKNENENISADNEKLNKELAELEKEKQQLEEQIKAVKEMNTLEFWKFKKE